MKIKPADILAAHDEYESDCLYGNRRCSLCCLTLHVYFLLLSVYSHMYDVDIDVVKRSSISLSFFVGCHRFVTSICRILARHSAKYPCGNV